MGKLRGLFICQVPAVGLGVKQNFAFLGPAVRHIVRCVVFDLLLVAGGWWVGGQ